jgi:hypothetical protein
MIPNSSISDDVWGMQIIVLAPFLNFHPHYNDDFYRSTWARRIH